jgi:hypothetical protein
MKIKLELTRAQAELLKEVVEIDILRIEGRDMDGKQMILQRLYAISAKLDDELVDIPAQKAL